MTLSFIFWGLVAFIGWQDYCEKRDPANIRPITFVLTAFETMIQIVCVLSIVYALNLNKNISEYPGIHVAIIFCVVFFIEYYRKNKVEIYLPVLCLSLYFYPLVLASMETVSIVYILGTCVMIQIVRFILIGVQFRLLFSNPVKSLKGAPLYFLTLALLSFISMGFEKIFLTPHLGG